VAPCHVNRGPPAGPPAGLLLGSSWHRWMEEYGRRLGSGWYGDMEGDSMLAGSGVNLEGAINLFPRSFPAAATAITRGVKVGAGSLVPAVDCKSMHTW